MKSRALIDLIIESFVEPTMEQDAAFCKEWLSDRGYDLDMEADPDNGILFMGRRITESGVFVAELAICYDDKYPDRPVMTDLFYGMEGTDEESKELLSMAMADEAQLTKELKARHTPQPYDPFDL